MWVTWFWRWRCAVTRCKAWWKLLWIHCIAVQKQAVQFTKRWYLTLFSSETADKFMLSKLFSAYDNGRSTDIFRSISLYVRSITHLSCKFVRTSSARSFTKCMCWRCEVPEKLLTLNRVSIIFIALKYIIKIEYGFYLAAHKSTYHGSL